MNQNLDLLEATDFGQSFQTLSNHKLVVRVRRRPNPGHGKLGELGWASSISFWMATLVCCVVYRADNGISARCTLFFTCLDLKWLLGDMDGITMLSCSFFVSNCLWWEHLLISLSFAWVVVTLEFYILVSVLSSVILKQPLTYFKWPLPIIVLQRTWAPCWARLEHHWHVGGWVCWKIYDFILSWCRVSPYFIAVFFTTHGTRII